MADTFDDYLLDAEDELENIIDFTKSDNVNENVLPTKTTEFYYQEYTYVQPTQADFDHKQIQSAKLFDELELEKEALEGNDGDLRKDASILVTGFGMRNVDSFQRLIEMSHEERRKWELRKLWRDQSVKLSISRDEERRLKAEELPATDTSLTSSSSASRISSDSLTQTESTTNLKVLGSSKKYLDYLLGLQEGAEEDVGVIKEKKSEPEIEEFKYSTSKSICEAQKYLRNHRIFEFFQFIIAHLLSSGSDNPIEFILKLLNQCLLYRSGMGSPPLLYQKKHIQQLFRLMDKMKTGFVEKSQYVTGMKTFGICTFNDDPDVTDEDLVSEDTFIEEIYNAELMIFEDMIRRQPIKSKQRKPTECVMANVSRVTIEPPYFIPSALFKFEKNLSTKDDSTGG
ncbi:hypothetical protein GWI33_015101 [Rhynchophorus ferrugineus]|uniref:EF-hand domain-containing protein n=1 Tax=Rhynchophorus ferrugineus TaxID=354439 RepID=A0A834IDW6_RHYFE|nr:hypothetical protein GWI33_015101 [Rhynchophorus ferrugineus]